MKLKLVKSTVIENWYLIEKAEHDGKEYMEETEHGFSLMKSARISDACVEGTAQEMLAIAKAIRERGSFRARRCAVDVCNRAVSFESPRNSQVPGVVSLHDADKLADEIERVLS